MRIWGQNIPGRGARPLPGGSRSGVLEKQQEAPLAGVECVRGGRTENGSREVIRPNGIGLCRQL